MARKRKGRWATRVREDRREDEQENEENEEREEEEEVHAAGQGAS